MDQTNEKNLAGTKSNMPVAIYYYVSTMVVFWLLRWLIIFIITFILGVVSLQMARNGNNITNGFGILVLSGIIADIIAMFFACKISAKRIFKQYKTFDIQNVIKLSFILFIIFYIIYMLWSFFAKPVFNLIDHGLSFIISSALFYLFTKKNIQARNNSN